MRLAVLALAVCSIPAFGQYSIQHDGDVVRLVDSAAKVTVLLTAIVWLAGGKVMMGATFTEILALALVAVPRKLLITTK